MTGIIASIVYCYVGCASGAPDGEALNVLRCDTQTGHVRIIQTVRDVQRSTYFQVGAQGKGLFLAPSRDGTPKLSRAVVFDIGKDGMLGDRKVLADLPCEAPCHVALSPDGKLMAFAAYSSATVGLLPTSGGEVSFSVLKDVGMGNFPGRQKKAYAHFAFFTPDGSRFGAVDLGCDSIHFFDSRTMEKDESMTIKVDCGDGPRHAVWSKDSRHLFVLNELSNTVVSFAFDGRSFTRKGKYSTLPDSFSGQSKAAAIKLTSDGKILMASNRGCDSIAFFEVDEANGVLTRRNIAMLNGSFPRDFELMPGEKFMIVGHKRSNEIQVYSFDRDSCTLAVHGSPVKAWMPLCFKFL